MHGLRAQDVKAPPDEELGKYFKEPKQEFPELENRGSAELLSRTSKISKNTEPVAMTAKNQDLEGLQDVEVVHVTNIEAT